MRMPSEVTSDGDLAQRLLGLICFGRRLLSRAEGGAGEDDAERRRRRGGSVRSGLLR